MGQNCDEPIFRLTARPRPWSVRASMSRPPAKHALPLVAALLFVYPASGRAVIVKDNLYGVKAVGASEAWTVGNFGSIYHTSDGGRTWEPRDSGTRAPLFGVDFSDAQHGWVVGKSGLILRTTDGGHTWTPQKSPIPPDKHLFNVQAVSETTAWVVGDWGAVATTKDGGTTWEDRSIDQDVVLYSVSFPDPAHGFIVGEFGTVLATADAGATWTKQDTGTDKTLLGTHFSTPQTGWAVGLDGLLLHTRDGGKTWEVQRGTVRSEALEDLGFLEALKNPGFYAVSVVGQYGVVVGDTGTLLITADGGETWSERTLPEKDRLRWMRDVSLVPGTHGLAVGAGGFTVGIARDQIVLSGDDKPAAPVP